MNTTSRMENRARTDFVSARSGQAILLVVLVIGGAMLGATTIAGFLVTIQLQQVGDADNSAKAIFAADAGINCALYDFNHPSGPTCFDGEPVGGVQTISLSNQARAEVICYSDGSFEVGARVPCSNQTTRFFSSKGISRSTTRAFLYTILGFGEQNPE